MTTPTEEELKESDVVIVTNEECKKNYTTVDIPVLDTMLCGSVMTLDGQDVRYIRNYCHYLKN